MRLLNHIVKRAGITIMERAKSEIGEIWRFSFVPSEFKVWVDPKYQFIRGRISNWKESKQDATYYYPNGAVTWDYVIPMKLYNRAAKLLGLPPRKKHPSRVRAGQATLNLKSFQKSQKHVDSTFKTVPHSDLTEQNEVCYDK